MARTAPADYREFIRVSVDLPLNPKLAMIDEPAAGWAYVVSLCYCGQNLTDGSFPLSAVLRLAGVKRTVPRLLIDAGLWHETGHDCPRCPQPMAGSAVVHDYLEHQRSAEEARSLRDARREAGRKGAASRWSAKPDGKSHGKSHGNGKAPATTGGALPTAESRSRSDNGASAPASADGQISDYSIRDAAALGGSSAPRATSPRMASAMASAMANGWQVDGKSMAEVEVEEELKKKTSSSSSGTGRKRPTTRLPDTWRPTDNHRRYASEHSLEIETQRQLFVAHAEANDRRCASWNAAFTQWLIKADEIQRARRGHLRLAAGQHQPYRNPSDQSVYDEPMFPTEESR
jgi:hypothetical protein